VTNASHKPDGGDRSAVSPSRAAGGERRVKRAKRCGERDWRVVDDISTPVPISARELDVIERWLAAMGILEFGGSSAENTRTAPNRIGAGENPEAVSSTKGDTPWTN
jgi:hypothetical protein